MQVLFWFASAFLLLGVARAQRLPTKVSATLSHKRQVNLAAEMALPSDLYLAIGLSENSAMPETAIVACFGANRAPRQHFANSYFPENISWGANKLAYDGRTCSFSAPTRFGTFNLLDGFFLHLVSGQVRSDGQLVKHDATVTLRCTVTGRVITCN